MTKEIHDINTRALDFVVELIDYIAEYPDDDYMTMECLCRKLVKHGLLDKADGYYQTHDICTNTHECVKDTHDKTENSSEKPNNCDEPQRDEFELFDREALILLIECQRERIAELLAKTEPQYILREPTDEEMQAIIECAKDEPQTYVINPQEPTNDEKCFECDDFFTCGGQCNKIEDESQTENE